VVGPIIFEKGLFVKPFFETANTKQGIWLFLGRFDIRIGTNAIQLITKIFGGRNERVYTKNAENLFAEGLNLIF